MPMSFDKKIIISIITLTMFIELLDSTALNTSLPQIAQTFFLKTHDLSILITIYLFALGIGIPVSGFCVRKFGSRKLLIFATTLFMFGSLGCGYSNSINELVFFRLIQGIGGSFMMPVGRLIIASVFGQDLIKAMSIVTTVSLSAPVIGPVFGGYLTTYFGWQWIFFINIPFLILSILLSLKYLPKENNSSLEQFDFIGFLILLSGFALFIFSSKFQNRNHELIWGLISAFIGLGIIYLYIPYSKISKRTLIDLNLLTNHSFKNISIGNFLIRISNGILYFLIPILLYEHYHYSPFNIGLFMLPFIIGTWCIKPFLTKIIRQDNNKSLLILNSGVVALGQSLFFLFIQLFNPLTFILYGVGMGILNSLQIALMNSSMFISLQNKDRAHGNALYLSLSEIGCCIGITLATFIFILVDTESRSYLVYYSLTFILTIITIAAHLFFRQLSPEAFTLRRALTARNS